ncbi:transporter substrate-binding domain-containing protein [Defluviimonas sp. D31]|uniref:transporter substrate-binding domain-containing protein n=1 Tax=Defluviimonas sp. D31 TaxID=3083253 RepID=UPI00296FE2F2|nr:transporter substrate-binding domain-containing protein [Defluviimonas sp. D31]MDW4549720.1 transporter substrate-binding domain-containing protein [Defluviimonas sp. D31]
MRKFLPAAMLLCSTALAGAEELKVCVEGAYPPMSMMNEKGEIVGMDIDLTNALCAEIGASCALVKTDWDAMIPSLMEGKCDAIIASMSITPERAQIVAFTEKYLQSPNMFIGRADAGMTDTAEGLAGKRVGVQRGTVANDFMAGEFPEVELGLYGSEEEIYLDLAAGRVDAAFVDAGTGETAFLKTEAGEGFAYFGAPHIEEKYFGKGAGIALRPGEDDLRERLNGAILTIRDNGKYAEINNKYFTTDQYGG